MPKELKESKREEEKEELLIVFPLEEVLGIPAAAGRQSSGFGRIPSRLSGEVRSFSEKL